MKPLTIEMVKAAMLKHIANPVKSWSKESDSCAYLGEVDSKPVCCAVGHIPDLADVQAMYKEEIEEGGETFESLNTDTPTSFLSKMDIDYNELDLVFEYSSQSTAFFLQDMQSIHDDYSGYADEGVAQHLTKEYNELLNEYGQSPLEVQ